MAMEPRRAEGQGSTGVGPARRALSRDEGDAPVVPRKRRVAMPLEIRERGARGLPARLRVRSYALSGLYRIVDRPETIAFSGSWTASRRSQMLYDRGQCNALSAMGGFAWAREADTSRGCRPGTT